MTKLSDLEIEFAKARHLVQAFDAIFDKTWSDDTETCQRCGRKSRPPCKCGDVEPPPYRPDTGWGL